MASSRMTSPLELLQPETQSLILCHISTAKTLHSLISASPRFYQVFKSRREYHLTQLAMQQCGHSPSAWDAITASNLSKPLSLSAAERFIEQFFDDDGWKASVLPLDVSIPMIRLGTCVEWFIADFAHNSLLALTQLKEHLKPKQDDSGLQCRLSEVETSRNRRAFFRFELSRHMCQPKSDAMESLETLEQNGRFLLQYGLDNIEEVSCVKDYIFRRLWAVFDQIEDDLAEGPQARLVQKTLEAVYLLQGRGNSFDVPLKQVRLHCVEHMMFRGLSFLKDVLTTDKERCTELVLSASAETPELNVKFLTESLDNAQRLEYPLNKLMFHESMYRDDSKFRDCINELSLGWRWFHAQWRTGYTYGEIPRDWGYIFWSPKRLPASGIFDM